MSVKFKYPRGRKTLAEAEEKLMSSLGEAAEPAVPVASVDMEKTPTAKDGFVRLVDFIKLKFLESKRKDSPEELKRKQAIQAYKKIKDAA